MVAYHCLVPVISMMWLISLYRLLKKSKGNKNEDVIKLVSSIKDFPGAMGNLSMDKDGALNGKAVVKKL